MPTTITSFYDFTPGTKARAGHVNTNFSAFRGDAIPVDPNTAASADLTYDLGTTEYRWKDVYLQRIMLSDVTTAGLYIQGSSTGTAVEIYIDNTLSATLDSGGVARSNVAPRGITTSAGIGDIAANAVTTGLLSLTTTGYITIAAATLQTNGGPIGISFQHNPNATTFGGIEFSGSVPSIQFLCMRDATTIGLINITHATFTSNITFTASKSMIRFQDRNAAAGTYSYQILGKIGSDGGSNAGHVEAVEIQALEI